MKIFVCTVFFSPFIFSISFLGSFYLGQKEYKERYKSLPKCMVLHHYLFLCLPKSSPKLLKGKKQIIGRLSKSRLADQKSHQS